MEIDLNSCRRPENATAGALDQSLSADQIRVRLFRQTLFWPLALVVPPENLDKEGNFLAAVSSQVAALDAAEPNQGGWSRLDDPLAHLPLDTPQQRQDAYAEFVYFHEFIQQFLYRRQDKQVGAAGSFDQPFRLYSRCDVSHFDVAFSGGGEARSARFSVERCLLYVFRTGVAILAVDLTIVPTPASPVGATLPDMPGRCVNDNLRLSDTQTLLDLVRRAYSPFFVRGAGLPPLVVSHAQWRRSDGAASVVHSANDNFCEVARLIEAKGERAPPMFGHWRELLPTDWKIGVADGSGIVWRHIVDERMPVLACVSVGEPGSDDKTRRWYGSIHRNDLIRLCFADKEGDPNDCRPPCDPAALENFERDHCFRRFEGFGSLYLVSGYGFVQVLSGSDESESVFGMHMRRHYYQIMLLAQFELASMLAFSSRITGLVRAHDFEKTTNAQDAEEHLERRMRALQSETMDFIHRFRFTGVTNQLQGQELSGLLRGHLRIDAVYRDLRDELDSGAALLARRAQDKETSSTGQLSVVATFGLAASVATSLLGMNVFFSDSLLKHLADPENAPVHALLSQGAVAGCVFAFVFWFAAQVISRKNGGRIASAPDRRLAGIKRDLLTISRIAFVLFLALSLVYLGAVSTHPSADHARPTSSAAPAP